APIASDGNGRLKLVVFLTDGLPTVGETDVARILATVTKDSQGIAGLRLFSFGVGADVNTLLLDRLATDQHGVADYVEDGENLETRLSGFFAKIAEPVLLAPTLDLAGADVFDVVPQPLPDLFAGDQLV